MTSTISPATSRRWGVRRSLGDLADDAAGVARCEHVVRDVACDDGARPDPYARQDERPAADPHVG